MARFDVMYRQSRLAQAVNIAASLLLCYGIWGAANKTVVVAWWMILGVFTALRWSLSVAYFRATPARRSKEIWQTLFILTLISTSMTWGIGSLFIMPEGDMYRLMVFVFLIGLAGGTTTSYSAYPPCAMIGVICLLVPSTVAFLFDEQVAFRIIALGTLLYMAGLARGSHRLGEFVGHSLELSQRLEKARRDAESRAMTDELTGLSNRGAFYELGMQALRVTREYNRPLAAIVIDLDHFKRINDRHGHAAGDAALRAVASVISGTRRDVDIAGRLGGDEFAILLPETAPDIVHAMAERVRRDVESHPPIGDAGLSITCSLGVAVENRPDSLESLLGTADQALYRAKHQGRNRIVAEALPGAT